MVLYIILNLYNHKTAPLPKLKLEVIGNYNKKDDLGFKLFDRIF